MSNITNMTHAKKSGPKPKENIVQDKSKQKLKSVVVGGSNRMQDYLKKKRELGLDKNEGAYLLKQPLRASTSGSKDLSVAKHSVVSDMKRK